MATLNTAQFFVKHLGKEDNDFGSVKGACVNLVKSYFVEVLGLPVFYGNAIDYAHTQIQGLQTPNGQGIAKPMPGDIVVFHNAPYDPTYGHIGICVWSEASDFCCMEQNFPEGSPCEYHTHSDFQNILCILRPNLPENSTPRPTSQSPHSDISSGKFIMNYTSINTPPTLLEQARQLLVKYSGGKLDCSFQHQQLPPIFSPTLWTSEEQALFLKNFPVSTPFAYLTYIGNDPGHIDATTLTVAGYPTVVTAAFADITPFYVCYEFCHAITEYLLDKGYPVGIPDDIFTPNEAFLQAKMAHILPFVDKLLVSR